MSGSITECLICDGCYTVIRWMCFLILRASEHDILEDDCRIAEEAKTHAGQEIKSKFLCCFKIQPKATTSHLSDDVQ